MTAYDAALGQFIRKLVDDGGDLYVRHRTDEGYSEQRITLLSGIPGGGEPQPTTLNPSPGECCARRLFAGEVCDACGKTYTPDKETTR